MVSRVGGVATGNRKDHLHIHVAVPFLTMHYGVAVGAHGQNVAGRVAEDHMHFGYIVIDDLGLGNGLDGSIAVGIAHSAVAGNVGDDAAEAFVAFNELVVKGLSQIARHGQIADLVAGGVGKDGRAVGVEHHFEVALSGVGQGIQQVLGYGYRDIAARAAIQEIVVFRGVVDYPDGEAQVLVDVSAGDMTINGVTHRGFAFFLDIGGAVKLQHNAGVGVAAAVAEIQVLQVGVML